MTNAQNIVILLLFLPNLSVPLPFDSSEENTFGKRTNPRTRRRQKPNDGKYKVLSATTNPTYTNKFEDMRNGTDIQKKQMSTVRFTE